MKLHTVELMICEDCLNAVPEMCHTPGCIFIRQLALEWPLDRDQIKILRTDESSLFPEQPSPPAKTKPAKP